MWDNHEEPHGNLLFFFAFQPQNRWDTAAQKPRLSIQRIAQNAPETGAMGFESTTELLTDDEFTNRQKDKDQWF
jgi:hypothetical protein